MATKEATTTKDHDTIKNWVEERDGRPAKVKDTDELLRIDFQEKDSELEEISWEKFFEIFDGNSIEFLYQEEKKDGEKSTFCKFVSSN